VFDSGSAAAVTASVFDEMSSVIWIAEAISAFFPSNTLLVLPAAVGVCLNYWLCRPLNPEVVITAVARINPARSNLFLSRALLFAVSILYRSRSRSFTFTFHILHTAKLQPYILFLFLLFRVCLVFILQ
jgi:hypothetical protein